MLFVKNVLVDLIQEVSMCEGIHQEDVKASFGNGELKIVVPKEAPKQIEENKFIPIE